ncbi:hypothetical protein S245_012619, partial [Arachis hypogaea]
MNSLKRYQRPPAVILQSFKIKVNRDMVLRATISVDFIVMRELSTDTVHSFFINSLEKKLFSKFKQRGLPLWVIVAPLKSSMSLVMHDFSTNFRLISASRLVLFLYDVSFDSAFSPIFEDFSRYGQLRSYENQLIFGVPIQPHSIKEMLADILCAKIYSSASRNDQICFLIGEIIDVLKHQKVECVDAIGRYRIKIIVSHSNGRNIFILEDDEVMQSTNDYTVSNGIISQLMNKKIVLIVDPRPVGYELNTSLHVVRAVCDDVEIVKFLKDSSHDNQQQVIRLLSESNVELLIFFLIRNLIWIPLFLIFLLNLRIQFSFTPMQAFSVHRAQVLQWVRLHPFLFSTGIVG